MSLLYKISLKRLFSNHLRNILMGLSSLILAIVRNFHDYRTYAWDSFWSFLISWGIHFVAIGFIAGFVYVLLSCYGNLFGIKKSEVQIDTVNTYVFLTILIFSLGILSISGPFNDNGKPPTVLDDYYDNDEY